MLLHVFNKNDHQVETTHTLADRKTLMKKRLILSLIPLALIVAGLLYYKHNQKNLDLDKGAPDTIASDEEPGHQPNQKKQHEAEVSSNYPLFVAIPQDWFKRSPYGDDKQSTKIRVKMKGRLSWLPNLNRSGDIYFIPDGGTDLDEIRIMCDRPLGSISCYDEPNFAQYDDQGAPIGVGIRQELKMLIDDSRAMNGTDPQVVIEGSIIERKDQRLGKIRYSAESDMNIFLIDGTISDKNKKSREMRLNPKR